MVTYQEELTQRETNFAIVDEVDSILVDEARSISSPVKELLIQAICNRTANVFVKTLIRDTTSEGRGVSRCMGITVDEGQKQVALNEAGIKRLQRSISTSRTSQIR